MSQSQRETRHLVTAKVVAEVYGVSLRQVERMTAAGKIPGAMKLGASRRYHLPTVLKDVEERAKKSQRR